jgi:hypothetical protein
MWIIEPSHQQHCTLETVGVSRRESREHKLPRELQTTSTYRSTEAAMFLISLAIGGECFQIGSQHGENAATFGLREGRERILPGPT